MTEHGRHRRRYGALHRATLPVAAAAAVVAVLATAVWATTLVTGRPAPEATATAAAVDTTLTQATNECRAARLLVTQDLVAAGGSIQQWRLHINAMNDLVAGRITLAQATAFWDATRVEGKRTLALWKRVDQQLRSAGLRCAAPRAGAAKRMIQALRTCQRRQAAAEDLLLAARATLADWDTHIAQMDALRAGKITPAHALHMWHMMYQRGRVGLKAYDDKYARYDSLLTCPLG